MSIAELDQRASCCFGIRAVVAGEGDEDSSVEQKVFECVALPVCAEKVKVGRYSSALFGLRLNQ
jgi:hypothetical protein